MAILSPALLFAAFSRGYAGTSALWRSHAKPIVLYNIPYRTCVQSEQRFIARLAAHDAIVGINAAGSYHAQSAELLAHFARRLFGDDRDDSLFFTAVAQGPAGGILARRISILRFSQFHADLLGRRSAMAPCALGGSREIVAMRFAEPSPVILLRLALAQGPAYLPLGPPADDLNSAGSPHASAMLWTRWQKNPGHRFCRCPHG